MYDRMSIDDLLTTAAEWLMETPQPTHTQTAAAATLLLEASHIRRGKAALTGAAQAAPARVEWSRACLHCSAIVGLDPDCHERDEGHAPMVAGDGFNLTWSHSDQAWQAASDQAKITPARGTYVYSLLCCSGWLDIRLGVETRCSECGTTFLAPASGDGTPAPAADVSRETPSDARSAALANRCHYVRGLFGNCVLPIGHHGDHVDGAGDIFADFDHATGNTT